MAAQKRARYNGPQKVVVHWPPGETNVGNPDYQTWEVEPGGLLPADAPAKLRDELAANPDWTEVRPRGRVQKRREGVTDGLGI